MSDFPVMAWHYRLRLEIDGADRQQLPDCLEAEDLAIFAHLDREEAYARIREGSLAFDGTFAEPMPAFAQDLSILSLYLFQIVKGFEVAERFVSPVESDDARAWKIVARRGDWVKLPLVVGERAGQRFVVDEDADDLEVIEARWAHYPRWFQDGMRRKHPTLRRLQP